MGKETIKKLFHLNYDNQPYPLPIWYNQLLDKTTDEIDLKDIFRMINNNILPELAIEKAIDAFIVNPFDGEMMDGQILELFVNKSSMFFNSKNVKFIEMINIIEKMDNDTAQSKEQWGYEYDYDEEGCKKYLILLDEARKIIKLRNRSFD